MKKIDKPLVGLLAFSCCLLIFTYTYNPYSTTEEFLRAKSLFPFFLGVGSRLVAFILLIIAGWRSIRILLKNKVSLGNKIICYVALLAFVYFIFGYLYTLFTNEGFSF